jgi:hypothetical protein|tara:strand:+ start:380 stop:610 length:231 start_codon:yes stop_codon:yes gene_type:complete|eukprot:COSAG01_NODE_1329_length_10704_cov_34.202074_4_plen_77_part_00
MDIRKISVGPDYKSGAMHYLVGQQVLGGNYTIHLIKFSIEDDTYQIYIEDSAENEILLWKQFNSTMPISLEYNINF